MHVSLISKGLFVTVAGFLRRCVYNGVACTFLCQTHGAAGLLNWFDITQNGGLVASLDDWYCLSLKVRC